MKYLVLILVILVAIMLWKKRHRPPAGRASAAPPPPPATPPLTMARCHRCGVHLPQAEAVQGRLGVYCSVTHRDQTES